MNTQLPPARDHEWATGEQAVFHYSLAPDPTSEISQRLAHRTGQVVTVTGRATDDADYKQVPTFEERANEACLAVYSIKFPDGHEDCAFEDELVEVE